jgi:2-polyprenyl-6-methoxyphenol hydroxylase-like FAD-dependent oxidoreductase
VLVLGDAAHAIGPVWAQGAALAMEDALVLARLLSVGTDWSAAVDEWERLRRPRVEGVLAATDRMSRLARLPDAVLRVTGPRLGPRGYAHAYGPLRSDPVADLSGSARPPS